MIRETWTLTASMGPRSSDRGNKLAGAGAGETVHVLQWGRDHLIAEMTRRSSNRMGGSRFNGAAII